MPRAAFMSVPQLSCHQTNLFLDKAHLSSSANAWAPGQEGTKFRKLHRWLRFVALVGLGSWNACAICLVCEMTKGTVLPCTASSAPCLQNFTWFSSERLLRFWKKTSEVIDRSLCSLKQRRCLIKFNLLKTLVKRTFPRP